MAGDKSPIVKLVGRDEEWDVVASPNAERPVPSDNKEGRSYYGSFRPGKKRNICSAHHVKAQDSQADDDGPTKDTLTRGTTASSSLSLHDVVVDLTQSDHLRMLNFDLKSDSGGTTKPRVDLEDSFVDLGANSSADDTQAPSVRSAQGALSDQDEGNQVGSTSELIPRPNTQSTTDSK